MDLQLPNIYFKEVIINPNYEIVTKTIEQWFSKYLNTKWTDDSEITTFSSYLFPKCTELNKLILIAKALTWIFMFDDYMDKYPDQMQHWLKIFENQKAITTDPLEVMYETIINELMEEPFEYSQKIRIMESFTMFVESYKTSSKIRNGGLKATMTEFVGCRYADSFMPFIFLMVEYDLGINLSDKWHIEVFRELHFRIAEHTLVTNDIYSYKKEMKNNAYPEYSFMSILRNHSNMTFKEALEESVKRVERIDEEISDLFYKVKSFAHEIPVEYMDGIIDLKDGILYWTNVCKRYKSF